MLNWNIYRGGRGERVGGELVSDFNPWDGYLVDDVAHAGRRQSAYMREIVDQRLPTMRGGHDAPLVIGGDCNTLAAHDWTADWADCPNKLGTSYDLTGTRVFTGAASWTRSGRPTRTCARSRAVPGRHCRTSGSSPRSGST